MTLSRRKSLALLTAAATTALAPVRAPARQSVAASPLSYGLRPQALDNGIWMIEGKRESLNKENGGDIVNVVLIETDAGLVVVDTGSSRRYGEELRGVAEQVTGQAVTEVWITHHHPDHFLGNQAFADLPIRSTEHTVEQIQMHGDAYADALYRIVGGWMRGTAPLAPNAPLPLGEVEVGGRRLRLEVLSGHTGSDLVILDRATGILIASDLVFVDYAPTTPDADLDAWRTSLDRLHGVGAAGVIPGHGPFDPEGRGLVQTRHYLDWLETHLREAAGRGWDMMEAMAPGPAPDFSALGAQPEEFQRSVIHLFPGIERAVLPAAN